MKDKFSSKIRIKAAVIGGSGFTGLEVLKILSNHKNVEIAFTSSNTYNGMPVGDVFPSFTEFYEYKNLKFLKIDKVSEAIIKSVDVVFLCLPPLESMEFVSKYLIDFRGVIIDLGSDFRLKDPENFKNWYSKEHVLKEILPSFVYGLPEIYSEKIKKARFIANPGCYPTSSILAIAPIVKNEVLKVGSINIDAKSGVSGAGRKLQNDYLFCSINENFYAYSPVFHRHIGEIEQELANISGRKIKVCFTPHLIPVNRGIFTTVYCTIVTEIKDKNTLNDKIFSAFKNFYSKSIFVKFLGERVPHLKDVIGTNMCLIGFAYDERTKTLKIFSVIDNLLKGAAGQAVQNMNLIFGFNEWEGLKGYGIFS